MLTKPDISDDAVVSVLNGFGLRSAELSFLPSGDANSAVYRVTTDDRARYVLKSRCGNFDEIAATVPAWLYSRGLLRVMAVHAITLPPNLARRVPRESYSPRNRTIVKALDSQLDRRSFDNPVAAQLAAFWISKRGEIQSMVERTEQLADKMPQQAASFVLCHSDLHAGNVLVGADNQLTIVDWDNPIFAPKERDLMFVGGGIGGSWNDPRESEWFFTGYGPAEIDPIAIAFYRYERIVVDIAEYGQRIFDPKGTPGDQQSDLRKLMGGFAPNNVIDTVRKSFLNLP